MFPQKGPLSLRASGRADSGGGKAVGGYEVENGGESLGGRGGTSPGRVGEQGGKSLFDVRGQIALVFFIIAEGRQGQAQEQKKGQTERCGGAHERIPRKRIVPKPEKPASGT